MNNNLVPKQTVRSDGVLTTVHVNPDKGKAGKARVDKVGTAPSAASASAFDAVERRAGDTIVTSKNGDRLHLDAAAVKNLCERAESAMILSAINSDDDAVFQYGIDADNDIFLSLNAAGNAVTAKSRSTGNAVELGFEDLRKISEAAGVKPNDQMDRDWGWTSTSGYVNVVESPVGSDYNHNLAITLGPDAMLTVYLETVNDADDSTDYADSTVSFYREGNDENIKVSFAMSDEGLYFEQERDSEEEEQFNDAIVAARAELKTIDSRLDIATDNPESPQVIFNYTSDGASKEQRDETVSFYTANVMHDAKAEWRAVEAQAFDVVYRVLN